MPSTNPISLVESSFKNLAESTFLKVRYDAKKNTSTQQFQTQAAGKVVFALLRDLYPNFLVFAFSETQMWLQCPDNELLIQVRFRSANLCNLEIAGDETLVSGVMGVLLESFAPVDVMISWVYSNDGGQFDIPLTPPKHAVTDAAYPYIEGGVEKFVDDFIASSENVLVLLGTPGTGKSTFLKFLLQHMKKDAMVTYDTGILEKDYFFGEFMEGQHGSLIMEDADTFLEARSAGNTLMHKFLNVGDGLVSSASKKIIFTTNLESHDKIDPALLRPGRCFSVVNFKALEREQARAFMSEYDPTYDIKKLNNKDYTLAELYNLQARNRTVDSTKKPFGFV
jgi:energy-coupling factor transporter ATP-binding protein EcfA2